MADEKDQAEIDEKRAQLRIVDHDIAEAEEEIKRLESELVEAQRLVTQKRTEIQEGTQKLKKLERKKIKLVPRKCGYAWCQSPPRYVNKMFRCSSCRSEWYCGTECQKRHWKQHKSICKQTMEKQKDDQAKKIVRAQNTSPGKDDERNESTIGVKLTAETRLEKEYQIIKERYGPAHDNTLTKAFEMMDQWIALYRLDKTDQFLKEVEPVCKKKRSSPASVTWYIKYVQMLAFCRYKQSRFKEAVELFHEMEKLVGASAFLCENIGHTYNTLGNYEKAEDYFDKALRLAEIERIDAEKQGKPPPKVHKGGVLLGLGLVKDRRGNCKGALPVLHQALEWYETEAQGKDNSLVAKSKVSVGKCYKNQDPPQYDKAEEYLRSAITIFERTCGEASPLTTNALDILGNILLEAGKSSEAKETLERLLEIDPDYYRNKG